MIDLLRRRLLLLMMMLLVMTMAVTRVGSAVVARKLIGLGLELGLRRSIRLGERH